MNSADPAVLLRDVQERAAQRVVELMEVFDTIVESFSADHLHEATNTFDATVAFERARISSFVRYARTQLAEIIETLDRLRRRRIG